MTVSVEQRVPVFRAAAVRIVSKYNLRRERSPTYINALRVGRLFSDEMVKIYAAMIGQDALICFRDWAYKNDIACDKISEIEKDAQKDDHSMYYNPSVRLYEKISFQKYTDILEQMLFNHKVPLTGRTPLTSEL